MLERLRLKGFDYRPSSEPFLHPGRSCDIFLGAQKAGFLGLLHPDIAEQLSLKVARPEIALLEADLGLVLSAAGEKIIYAGVPRHPHIDRDIAIIVDDAISSGELARIIRDYPSALIEDVSVFDFYKGKGIPEGNKSLAFTVRYRAKDRTLTDAEIEALHGELVRSLAGKTGGTIRGL